MAPAPPEICDPGSDNNHRSVRSISGLKCDERGGLKKALTEVIAKYCDMNKTWREQTDTAIDTYMAQATLAFPFLTRFENSWPARSIGKDILQRQSQLMGPHHASSRAVIPLPRGTDVRTVGNIAELTTAQRSKFYKVMVEEAKLRLQPERKWSDQRKDAQKDYVVHMSQRLPFPSKFQDVWPAVTCVRTWLYNQYYRANLERPAGPKSRSPSVVVVSMRQVRPRREPQGQTATVENAATPDTIRTRASYPPEVSLLGFLATSVGPAMAEEILPVLSQGGVTTVDHLNAVARLPAQELDKFLKNDLDLSLLQVRLVKNIVNEHASA